MKKEIGIMCDGQYQKLRELLGKHSTINSIDFFNLNQEDSSIVIEDKKVYVKFAEYRIGDMFKIDRIIKEKSTIKIFLIKLPAEDKYQFTDMPTEG